MKSVLIVTQTEQSATLMAEQLNAFAVSNITAAYSVAEARKAIFEHDFDLVIINSPLTDETGEAFARQIVRKEISQVMLLVRSEIFEMVSSVCEKDGVLTVAKPINRDMFRQALSLVRSTSSKLMKIRTENENLKQKIETIRLVDRAKGILMSSCGMTEQEAHRYIEKKAMDSRTSRQVIAERLIKDYEDPAD